jgi:hypothetical protein
MTLARSVGVERAVLPTNTRFSRRAVTEWCAALGITPVGYRDIRMLWTKVR